MTKIRFVKIAKFTHNLNWWYCRGLVGQTFEVLDVSPNEYVKIGYEEGSCGWLPLDVCEINPHLTLVKC